MSATESSQPIPPRCKKPITDAKLKPEMSNQIPDPTHLASKTPEKPPSFLPQRSRNRRMALSLKELRMAANTKRPQQTMDQIESAGEQSLESPSVKLPVNPSRVTPRFPEKYQLLAEFFYSLDGAIRLLKMKSSSPVFTNICPKVECLTDRRFSYSHLAQLKFILPEVIEIEKAVTFDEKTSCMKPDLRVTINADAIECDDKLKSHSKNLILRKVFRARLLDFLKHHPECDEIPEGKLPEPFNCSKSNVPSSIGKTCCSLSPDDSMTDASIEREEVSSAISLNSKLLNIIKAPSILTATRMSSSALDNQKPVAASQFPFRRHFSQKFVNNEAEKKKAEKESLYASIESSATPVKVSSKSSSKENCLTYHAASAHFPQCSLPATPVKEIEPTEIKDDSPMKVDIVQSTPAKLISTPARLITDTPALHPPKRCNMSPEDVSVSSPNKLTRRPTSLKSLKFDDDLAYLPETLIQSIMEKQKKAKEEQDPAISQAKWRRQMIACLPKLFNTIHSLFHSIKRSVITKEELIHKLISNHLQISDRREIEEQINLMLEFVPEWISEKLSSGGDLLVCINKLTCPETVRARLAEIK